MCIRDSYNPDDKHILIENRMQSGNYTFNYAEKGAWIFTGITCAITAGCIILVFVCMLPLINIQEKITLTNNNLTISAGGYKSEIDVNDITELKLLDELPDDSFLRTNGASTDSYDTVSYTHLDTTAFALFGISKARVMISSISTVSSSLYSSTVIPASVSDFIIVSPNISMRPFPIKMTTLVSSSLFKYLSLIHI